MKKTIALITFLFITVTQIFAQAPPQAFTYSGIARNNGQPIANIQIGIQLSIIEGTPTGTNVYTETQTTTTDTAGYFSVAVGFGTPSNGTFSTIAWGNGNHYLNVGIDTTGGNNYADLGTTQLLSVPYALFSGSSTNSPYERIPYDNRFIRTDTSYTVAYDSATNTNIYTINSTSHTDTTVSDISNYAEVSTFRNGEILLSVGTGYYSSQLYSFKVIPSANTLTFVPLFQIGQWTIPNGGGPVTINRTWSASGNISNGKIMLSQIIINTYYTSNEYRGYDQQIFNNFINQ